jgi:hypothetical protein
MRKPCRRISLKEIRKTMKHIGHDSRYRGRNLSLGPSEYEAGVWTTWYYSRPVVIWTCGHACSVWKQWQSHSVYSEDCAIAQTIRHRLLTTEPWVQSQVTSCQMSGERSCKEVRFSMLIIILPLVHTELSPLPDLCDSPERQHIIK